MLKSSRIRLHWIRMLKAHYHEPNRLQTEKIMNQTISSHSETSTKTRSWENQKFRRTNGNFFWPFVEALSWSWDKRQWIDSEVHSEVKETVTSNPGHGTLRDICLNIVISIYFWHRFGTFTWRQEILLGYQPAIRTYTKITPPMEWSPVLSALAPHLVGLTEAECACAAPCGSAGQAATMTALRWRTRPTQSPWRCKAGIHRTPALHLPAGLRREALRGLPAETAPASAGAAEVPADTGSDKDYRVDWISFTIP